MSHFNTGGQVPLFAYHTETGVNEIFSMRFSLPFSSLTCAPDALLPLLLSRACRTYPTFSVFSRHLLSLYGADLYSSVSRTGSRLTVSFTIDALAEKYLDKGDLIFPSLLSLLEDVIFSPLAFDDPEMVSAFLQEREERVSYLHSLISDKRLYTRLSALRALCPHEDTSLFLYGREEDVARLTMADMERAYHRLLHESSVSMVYIGYREANEILSILPYRLSAFIPACKEIPHDRCACKEREKPLYIMQSAPFTQSSVEVIYTFPVPHTLSEMAKSVFFEEILSSSPVSKLFVSLREKEKLCYDCATDFDRFSGACFIEAGCQASNISKIFKEISRQIEIIKKGSITEEEMECARASLRYRFASMLETPLDAYLFSDDIRLLCGDVDMQKLLSLIESVTVDDLSCYAEILRPAIFFSYSDGKGGE